MAINDSYTASVELWAGNYAPKNWAFCQGQLLAVAEYSALFSLLSNNFGGDARTNFALPDMRGRVPVGAGQSTGTSVFYIGNTGGAEEKKLSVSNIPAHSHEATFIPDGTGDLSGSVALPVKTGFATGGSDPVGKYFGGSGGTNLYYDDYTEGSTMADVDVDISGKSGTVTVQNAGGSYPFSIIQPYTALNYIICIYGTYPPRS